MAVEGFRLEKVDEWRWRIPRTGPMRTEGLVFASERILENLRRQRPSPLLV